MSTETTANVVAELRTERVSERIVTCRLMPYGETSYHTKYPRGERFARGALTKSLNDWAGARRPLKLFRAHQHHEAVGLAIGFEVEAPGGPLAEFRIATTRAGDDVLSEIEQGLLDGVSIGFEAKRDRIARDGVREVLEARIDEASLAPMGAYDTAEVLAHRVRSHPIDPEAFRLPPAPAYDLDAPLWAGLR